MNDLTCDTNIPHYRVDKSNLADFGELARRILEDSDHVHAGMSDNGVTYVYPCGTVCLYIFQLADLVDFVEARNVGIIDASKYAVLSGLIKLIRASESQQINPVTEQEVAQFMERTPGPAEKRGEAKYTDTHLSESDHPLAEFLSEKLVEFQGRPQVWDVQVNLYVNESDGGALSFKAKDLYEVADRLATTPFENGSEVSISLVYIG